jgi:hypothetical protein
MVVFSFYYHIRMWRENKTVTTVVLALAPSWNIFVYCCNAQGAKASTAPIAVAGALMERL